MFKIEILNSEQIYTTIQIITLLFISLTILAQNPLKTSHIKISIAHRY